MNKLEQAARQALEALEAETHPDWDCNSYHPKISPAIEALREALEAAPQPAAPTQDPAAWAITYDGRTPYTLWHEGDGPLLDLEIKRLAGSAQKMALYTAPQPTRQPLDQGRLRAMWVQYAPHIGAPLEFARAIEKAHGIGAEGAAA